MSHHITEQELAQIRAEQEIYMSERITIRGETWIAEDEKAPMDIATNVPARITPGFGFFREIADRMQGVTAFTITVPWDQKVEVGNDIINERTREKFHVRDVRDAKTLQTALQVLGDRVGHDGDS